LPHDWFANVYVPSIQAKPPDQRSINEVATLEDLPGTPRGLGRYGSGSAIVARTIPTPVPGDDRAGQDLPTFHVMADDYNAYYLNQLYEIFTQYGPIDELWLDGANPWSGSGIAEKYDFTTWFSMIHALSPDTVVFAGPQGTRWVGNEDGVARTTEWSVVATPPIRQQHTGRRFWSAALRPTISVRGSRWPTRRCVLCNGSLPRPTSRSGRAGSIILPNRRKRSPI